MKKKKQIRSEKSWEAFVKKTGLIQDDVILKALGFELTGDGAIVAGASTLKQLVKFCKKNKGFHIISQVENDFGTGYVYDNSIRIVNRLNYFLGTGSADENIFFNDRFERGD